MPRKKKQTSPGNSMIMTTIKLTPKEHDLAYKLAAYLYKYKVIESPTLNEVIRYSLLFLAYTISKASKQGGMKDGQGGK